MKIDWHKDCIQNQKQHLKKLKTDREIYLKNIDRQIERIETNIEFYDYQIKEAEQKKMQGFDRKRFKKKEKPDCYV